MGNFFGGTFFGGGFFGGASPVVVQTPAGVAKRRKKYTARLVEIEKREELGEFLKKRLNLPLIEEPKPVPKLVVKKSVLKVQEVDDNDMRKRILIMLGNIL